MSPDTAKCPLGKGLWIGSSCRFPSRRFHSRGFFFTVWKTEPISWDHFLDLCTDLDVLWLGLHWSWCCPSLVVAMLMLEERSSAKRPTWQWTHRVRKQRRERHSRIRTQPEVFSSRDIPVFRSKVIFPQLLSSLSPQINISAPCLTKQAFYRENDLKSKRIGTRHLALMVIITRLLWRTKNSAHLFADCEGNLYFSNLILSLSRFFGQVCSDLAK